MQSLQETLKILDDAKKRHDRVLVSYSGGKDSIVTLDLCIKTWGVENVECFYMFTLPGLRCIAEDLNQARDRWGVRIRQYPHPGVKKMIANGVYGTAWFKTDDLQFLDYRIEHVYALAMQDSGINLIAHGRKRADSPRFTKRVLATWGNKDYLLYPVVGWRRPDIQAYIQLNGLFRSKLMAEPDLSILGIEYMYDHYRDDFEKMEKLFPYMRAVIKRREWFGVTQAWWNKTRDA
jgi:phosphoadenosine phosphosulfate reductase